MHDQAAGSLILGDEGLTLAALAPLLGRPIRAQISPAAWKRVEASRVHVDGALASGRVLYGINTGFGNLKSVRIPPDRLELLQENLILSHAVGAGEPAPAAIVRFVLLLKLQSLLCGHSGVRRATVQLLADMLNADCLPVVPSRGSLGSSGDLAPLAHMVLPMIGRGRVHLAGQELSAAGAFERAGLKPIRLQAKEGLALINGTQYMGAVAAAAVVRARRLADTADIVAAMSLEACRGSAVPFDPRLHQARPHRGALITARRMRALLADSPIMASHAGCGKVQDPYSLRCIPQVHGASRDAIEHAAGVVEIEINSATDNPLIFEDGAVLSGGNFHGQPLALILDYLAMAVAELANISERRSYLLLDGADGLPPMLIDDPGVNSGLMILQYTAAALVNENKVLATPACVDSIPTSRGQEDHNSMGATSANKLLRILDNAETVLAIEALCAAQGLDYRQPLRAGRGAQAAYEAVRGRIAHASHDRAFADDLEIALQLIRGHDLPAAAAVALGGLEGDPAP